MLIVALWSAGHLVSTAVSRLLGASLPDPPLLRELATQPVTIPVVLVLYLLQAGLEERGGGATCSSGSSVPGSLRYNDRYVNGLKEAASRTQERRYPGDWVATFVEGDGEAFDYGIDITECGICKFYRAQGAAELAPYLCLSDYVVSDAFGRGLVRYKTLAEGAEVCDFRYKEGRETFVNPLREGWPPNFLIETEARS